MSKSKAATSLDNSLTIKSGRGVRDIKNPLKEKVEKKVRRNKKEYKKLLGIQTPPKHIKPSYPDDRQSPSKISNSSLEKKEQQDFNQLRKSKNSQS